MDLVHRIVVRGGAGGFEAAALIDGDVDEDGAGLHPLDQAVRHQRRGLGAGDEDRADDQVGLQQLRLDLVGGGENGVDRAAVDVVDALERPGIQVEDGDVGAQAVGHRDRGGADLPGADDRHARRAGAGDSGEEDAAAAEVAHQVVRADLHGQAAGDLAHRGQQRQFAVIVGDGFVGDGRRARVEQRLRAFWGRGQMEVREQDLALAHEGELRLDRLLDLQQQIALRPHLLGRVDDGRAGLDVRRIRHRGTDARPGFDEHLVAGARHGRHPGRARGDAMLAALDLAGDSDAHGGSWSAGDDRRRGMVFAFHHLRIAAAAPAPPPHPPYSPSTALAMRK